MSVEILGMITATPSSEVDQPLGEAVDAGFVRRFAQAHEDAGFDRVLVGYFSNAAEGAVVSSFVAAATRRLGVLLAYRPGGDCSAAGGTPTGYPGSVQRGPPGPERSQWW
ncbi:hypothetical protein HMPREF3150_00212 [Pseudomonas aeruginosa]|nr:hypothetical protein HMPREF3150_00212 [Pseudomonas aeruginosa]